MIRAWLARVLGLQRPQVPRLGALVARMDDLEAELEGLRLAFRKLRGQVTGGLRVKSAENAPGSTNGEEVGTTAPPPSMARLARLRRGF